MPVQDDARENQLIELFRLDRPPGAGRSDTDAQLSLGETVIPFEVKSSTRQSVSTVRDFGPAHVDKWQGKHWLFGFYNSDGTHLNYCRYASPAMMEPWINKMKELCSIT